MPGTKESLKSLGHPLEPYDYIKNNDAIVKIVLRTVNEWYSTL